MVKLSVVIITYNEEQNIARCLESVKEVADEILVVDSFSKDNTKTICETYGVRFIENPFEGHIQQKNFAASIAQYDHVLSLDADEALSDELKKSVLEVKKSFQADGYYVNRLSSYCGKWIYHCSWYPDKKLRLWDRRKGKWGGENPHDKYIMESNATTKRLKGDLLHYTFHTMEQHLDTVNKFSTIVAKERYRKGKKSNYFRVIFKPIIKFFMLYIYRLGFLDGLYGYIICKNSAHSAFLKEVKLMNLHRQNKKLK
jgi:glycosyltransferase involved in cell wall biosynthesis